MGRLGIPLEEHVTRVQKDTSSTCAFTHRLDGSRALPPSNLHHNMQLLLYLWHKQCSQGVICLQHKWAQQSIVTSCHSFLFTLCLSANVGLVRTTSPLSLPHWPCPRPSNAGMTPTSTAVWVEVPFPSDANYTRKCHSYSKIRLTTPGVTPVTPASLRVQQGKVHTADLALNMDGISPSPLSRAIPVLSLKSLFLGLAEERISAAEYDPMLDFVDFSASPSSLGVSPCCIQATAVPTFSTVDDMAIDSQESRASQGPLTQPLHRYRMCCSYTTADICLPSLCSESVGEGCAESLLGSDSSCHSSAT